MLHLPISFQITLIILKTLNDLRKSWFMWWSVQLPLACRHFCLLPLLP